MLHQQCHFYSISILLLVNMSNRLTSSYRSWHIRAFTQRRKSIVRSFLCEVWVIQKYHTLSTQAIICIYSVCTLPQSQQMTNRRRSDQHTPMHSCRSTQCMQTHVQHSDTHITCTQTPSATTYMFPLLSSLILEFTTEKAHPCFLLFKPDVSSSSLPLFSFSLVGWPLLSIVLWSGEFIFFLWGVHVCVCMCPQT